MPTGVPVLVEGFVVSATCAALAASGWAPTPVPHTAARGVDITAVKGRVRLLVEAKGAGSSVATSSRYGKPFTSGQVEISVAAAVYKALSVQPPDIAGVALPDLPIFHRKVNMGIARNLTRLDIAIFWVSEDGSVRIENDQVLDLPAD